jgi:hypothetical protein
VRAERVHAVDEDPTDLLGDRRIDDETPILGLEPEHRPDEHERGARRPGLRAARGGVRDGEPAELAIEPRERLGKAELAERGGLELGKHDPVRLVAEAVAREAERREGVVVRPDRADVVSDRVVPGVGARHRADAPAREHLVGEKLAGHDPGAVLRHDPRPQEMPHVRGHRVDPLLVTVEPDRVVAAARLRPEVAVESLEQISGLRSKTAGELRVAVQVLGELGDPELRVVDVPLDLRRRDGKVRNAPIGELHAVPRVLPALVPEPL